VDGVGAEEAAHLVGAERGCRAGHVDQLRLDPWAT